ncbi:MAG: NAD(P)-binding domain-containing protein [Sporichthyaceae bacterium]|nr:NAD(P)-binding domain-containing protein [Sporichthyaceae bacterium]
MRIGILGTGTVGRTLGARLVQLGHEVVLGARQATNEAARQWASELGERAAAGTFADAAAHGEVVVNATAGVASVAALQAAGADRLDGKVLVDVANPLDSSAGMPPTLSILNTDSLGEAIQRQFPAARVVKALNTINANVMVDPARVPGEHTVFVAGNDPAAKSVVVGILRELGWPASSVIDLGDITAARGLEMYLALWIRLMLNFGTADFNIKVVRP